MMSAMAKSQCILNKKPDEGYKDCKNNINKLQNAHITNRKNISESKLQKGYKVQKRLQKYIIFTMI